MERTGTKKEVFKRVGARVKSDAPKVSVIVPAYNVTEYIAEALDSVLAQTFRDFEIIVINDGSPDTEAFEKALEKYLEDLVYLKQENAGVGPARNVAIEHARGELLAFLDGDDAWLPEYLQEQIGFLEENSCDMVYADALLFGGSFLDGRTFMQDSPSAGKVDFESLLDLRCNVILSGAVARRKAVFDAGLFEPKNVRAQDFHLWLRIARGGAHIGYQTKVLLKYRVRIDSLSGDSVQRIRREIDVYHRVTDSIELNAGEQQIVDKHLRRLEADLAVEHGKSYLLQKDFERARRAFEKANEYKKSNRLRVIIWLVRLAPGVLLKLYRKHRAGDINFVPGGAK